MTPPQLVVLPGVVVECTAAGKEHTDDLLSIPEDINPA